MLFETEHARGRKKAPKKLIPPHDQTPELLAATFLVGGWGNCVTNTRKQSGKARGQWSECYQVVPIATLSCHWH